MSPTIHDVAARAGVSVATVSRVLNRHPRVDEGLRQRVTEAVTALEYRPNGPARNLRRRATSVLGIVISDVTNPFFTAMVRGIEDTAQSAGYSVVLANSDEDLEKELQYLEVAAAEQMAGVILAAASSTDTRVDVLTERGIPVVAIDRRLRSAQVDTVTVDNRRAALEATTHLLDQKCRRVAVIAGPSRLTTGSQRLAGYNAALRAAGRQVDPSLVLRSNFRTSGGYEAMQGLLRRRRPPDGLLVSNSLMTIGALEAIAEAGLETPTDIAVVGFDDVSWTTALRPQLSVIAQPTYDIGRRAAELSLERIGGWRGKPRRVVLPTTLLVRGSSLRSSRRR